VDEDIEAIFDSYSNEFSKLVEHLMNNPLVEKDLVFVFLCSLGSGLYKIGKTKMSKLGPNELDNHEIMLVPELYYNEASKMLKQIQGKYLLAALEKQLLSAKTEDERKYVQNTFDKIAKASDLGFSRG
jgi:hypothetical protein